MKAGQSKDEKRKNTGRDSMYNNLRSTVRLQLSFHEKDIGHGIAVHSAELEVYNGLCDDEYMRACASDKGRLQE
jgi:hypothetical protein